MQTQEYIQMPVIAMRGVVLMPNEHVGFDIGREMSISAAKNSILNFNGNVVLVCQKEAHKTDISAQDLYSVGTLCKITQMAKGPNAPAARLFVDALERIEIAEFEFGGEYIAASGISYSEPDCEDTLYETLRRRMSSLFFEYSSLTKRFLAEQLSAIDNIEHLGTYADAICALTLQKPENKQRVLEKFEPIQRLNAVYELLSFELEVAKLDNHVELLTKKSLDKNQKDYYLNEKIKAIRQELGETQNKEIEKFKQRMENKVFPEAVREKLKTEISRLENLPPSSHEAPGAMSYVELLLDLPWTEATDDNIDIAVAREILDRDHFGLEKVKQRIIEHLAIAKLTNNLSGQIICLVGPPGVGKTSIASAVAEAVGRKFVRMSIGGIDDESEIRGHRRTYIGSMCGRIINAMKQAKSINPVILFDEIDKLTKNMHGDPSAAMLEVLDPAQNKAFRDHYLELPYDLSNVMFITTANSLDTIPRPLLDRMEVIEVPSYLECEKTQIAMRHMVPKQLEKHGLSDCGIEIDEETILTLIRDYTMEAGVRELERTIASLCRKLSCDILEGKDMKSQPLVNRVPDYLGASKFKRNSAILSPSVGVVNGLAWTAYGGETLPIEAQGMAGTGKIEVTGNLGEVMRESAHAAITFIRANAAELGIESDYFTKHDLHIHA
ncbi:MAG: endopeptidase La, partial [Clostridiales bacterium]|nr:endopeptidase La [Clostridiales bacterium]